MKRITPRRAAAALAAVVLLALAAQHFAPAPEIEVGDSARTTLAIRDDSDCLIGYAEAFGRTWRVEPSSVAADLPKGSKTDGTLTVTNIEEIDDYEIVRATMTLKSGGTVELTQAPLNALNLTACAPRNLW